MTSEQVIEMIEIKKEELIAAPLDVVFETVLEQMGPMNEGPDGTPMPMKLEAWPGGRWFRDLDNNAGHLWGHVQAIKPPTLIEIYGPLFMSTGAISNVQYRLAAEGKATRLTFSHRAMGVIPPGFREGGSKGWAHLLDRVRVKSEGKATEAKK